MFRTFAKKFLPNPLDWMLKRAAKKNAKKVLIFWNRGLGDIALGLYAIIYRIKEFLPEAEITFLARENLMDGFSMLDGIKAIPASWKRGEKIDLDQEVQKFSDSFDLVIKNPSPTDWVFWQHGKITPRLKWDPSHDDLWKKFDLGKAKYVGVQISAETNYGFWRNWSFERWQQLFDELEKRNAKILLFGFDRSVVFEHKNIVDLRGKTSLFELLSIIQNCCFSLVLPDSGILSMVYYLDQSFPIRIISLWADPNHGVLKQGVASPNPCLQHYPIIGKLKDLSSVSVREVLDKIFPPRPLQKCIHIDEISSHLPVRAGAIILAGGQGTRLGFSGAKGLFEALGKSLFEHLCKEKRLGPIAVMTSPQNHAETVAFFEKNQNFGSEVYFFSQEEKTLLDENKNPTDLKGSNGNGNVFRAFVQSDVSCVDNPLANIFDSALISYGMSQGADAVVQCIEREPSDVSMGVLVERNGIEILEYTELDPKENYKYVYSGQIGFRWDFFLKMGAVDLPLHWVQKKVKNRLVWKGEQFIFDVLPYATSVCAVQVPRSLYYAPIKGAEHIEKVEAILKEKL
jgi:ADP-heptose:LPS heptosyltransferase